VRLDMYEAIGGIDLAVLDGTYLNSSMSLRSDRINTNVLLVGRDAVAVEAVGATLVSLDPKKMPIIQEAVKRSLGEGDMEKIEFLGMPIESLKERFSSLLKDLKKKGKCRAN